MAGVPYHSVDSYLQKLLAAGYKVAIGEQVEDPEEAKKRGAKSIVKREIVRTFTPAVKFDAETRDACKSSILPVLCRARSAP
jgi:DNA mismatch repair protein MutS